jgi:hypothetical protein
MAPRGASLEWQLAAGKVSALARLPPPKGRPKEGVRSSSFLLSTNLILSNSE